MLAPLQRGSLRGRLAGHLYDAIRQGDLRPGERIVEGKLARQLGVAQGTLREALQELEHQGLLIKEDHRGTFVSRLTREDIRDIYVVRRELEPLAAALARQRMTPEQLEQLSGLVNDMQTAGEVHNFAELLKIDLAFHRLIWKLSGSRAIERALNAVCPPLFALYLIKSCSGDPYDQAKDLEEHRALLKVLKEGDAERVKQAFEEIVDVFRSLDIENLQAGETEREIPLGEGQPTNPSLK